MCISYWNSTVLEINFYTRKTKIPAQLSNSKAKPNEKQLKARELKFYLVQLNEHLKQTLDNMDHYLEIERVQKSTKL